MQSPVIQTSNLNKVYGSGNKTFHALKDLNLTVNRGEIFGYLGPNGAGKTTTIRLLLDLIRPSSGSAQVLGYDINRQSVEIRRHIGFLPGELNLWKGLTGHEVVNYVAGVRGQAVDEQKRYARALGERLMLDFTKKVREYSTGNKRKLGLVIAMMHKPQLLILDEPTTGLDPLLQQTFNQMMREVRDEGRTVFLSSHILAEVQAICERVGIVRDGQLKAIERVTDLTHAKFHWVTVQFRERVNPVVLSAIDGVSELSTVNGDHTMRFKLIGDHDALIKALSQQYVVRMETREPTLEEIFLTFYGDNGKGIA
jgi:ABC-2 type transport system ATP-binding protein